MPLPVGKPTTATMQQSRDSSLRESVRLKKPMGGCVRQGINGSFMITAADTYFKKQKSPQKEICGQLRTIILETFPGIEETMKWGVPAYADGLFYIVALKDHVNLGFSSKSLSKEEMKLFDGGGKTTRHLQIDSLEIDKKKIVKLLKLAMAKRM